MLGIDIALLVGGAVLVVAVAALIGDRYGARPSPAKEAERRRKQGERNAEREKQRLDELCAACGERIDPDHDVWDAGSWWHKGCYREALR